jgi:cbb3-type cytochrome oxidase maturation protein
MFCRQLRKYFYAVFNNKPMSVIIILLAASISVAALFLGAFLWSVRSGQFDDDYSPSSRILFDDKPASPTNSKQN